MGEADIQAETEVNRQIQKRYGLIDLKTPIALPGRVQVKRFDHSLMRT
ncbi:unnamed protein product [Brassica rapa subsp. narinosa]